MYCQKAVDCGKIVIVTKTHAPMLGVHRKRSSTSRETSAAMSKLNERHAVDWAEAMLLVNFRPHDWHIALTYRQGTEIDEERAKKDLRNFLARLKRKCDKSGLPFKYFKMTEQGVRSNAWHHHVVLPQEIPMQLIAECWEHGMAKVMSTLYSSGDFRGLAQYFVDKTKGGKRDNDRGKYTSRYAFSRNCVKPTITYTVSSAKTWRKQPRPPKGYQLRKDSLYEGVAGYDGWAYQRYTLVRIE